MTLARRKSTTRPAIEQGRTQNECRRVAGLSALALAHERMLQDARRQLAHSNLAVAEIADLLGFEDAAYFSRFFARRCGLSPSAYRGALALGLVPG